MRIVSMLLVFVTCTAALSLPQVQGNMNLSHAPVTVPVGNKATDAGVLPRLIKFSGQWPESLHSNKALVTFSLFATPTGGTPLWVESQLVTNDKGHYAVLLGATHTDGLPLDAFLSNDARWLQIRFENSDPERRVLLVSVPYALKAADADTLGGRPPSDYMLTASDAAASLEEKAGSAPQQTKTERKRLSSDTTGIATAAAVINPGNTNALAKYVNGTDLGASGVFSNGERIGIGVSTPARPIHIRTADSIGPTIRLEDERETPGSFYDLQGTAGALGNFGFSRYENNTFVASKSLRLTSAGNFGIGKPNPAFKLDVAGSGNFDGNVSLGGRLGLAVAFPARPIHIRTSDSAGPSIRLEDARAVPGTFYDIQGTSGALGAFGITRYENNTAVEANSFRISAAGNFGMGVASPASKLDVRGSGTNDIVSGRQSRAGVGSWSVASLPPSAVHGDASATAGAVASVIGSTVSGDGIGVLGINNSGTSDASKAAVGVRGISSIAPSGVGVWGEADNSTGFTVGSFGWSKSAAGGTGIFGVASTCAAPPCGTTVSGDGVGVFGESDFADGTGVWGEVTQTTGANIGVLARVHGGSGAAGVFDWLSSGTGNILVGRAGTSPVNVFRVNSSGKGFFDSGTQVGGADFAESVDVLGSPAQYEAGDVLVIDRSGNRRVTKSDQPYSTLVAGIYSTKPGILATPHAIDDPRTAVMEVPLAVVGIVPCKVTTENGPIRVGDLLVTSGRAGYAMRGTDRSRMIGAVVGKALQSFSDGDGIIEVLVTLQ